MKPNLNQTDLYFITDSKLTRKSVLQDVLAAAKAGVKIIQYREKEKSSRIMYQEAKNLKEICDKYNLLLIINDRIDICLAVDADGIHLGNEDIPYEEARKLLPNKIIGVTVHNLKEAEKAQDLGADYIGVSPIFTTKTKPDAGPPSGLNLIKDIKKTIKIPFVPIGGINLGNIDMVIKLGATKAAVISAVVTKDDVETECKKFIKKFNVSKGII
jgi:thiamine-phosphate pyrophosphorylase